MLPAGIFLLLIITSATAQIVNDDALSIKLKDDNQPAIDQEEAADLSKSGFLKINIKQPDDVEEVAKIEKEDAKPDNGEEAAKIEKEDANEKKEDVSSSKLISPVDPIVNDEEEVKEVDSPKEATKADEDDLAIEDFPPQPSPVIKEDAVANEDEEPVTAEPDRVKRDYGCPHNVYRCHRHCKFVGSRGGRCQRKTFGVIYFDGSECTCY